MEGNYGCPPTPTVPPKAELTSLGPRAPGPPTTQSSQCPAGVAPAGHLILLQPASKPLRGQGPLAMVEQFLLSYNELGRMQSNTGFGVLGCMQPNTCCAE